MKKLAYIFLSLSILTACADKSDPFRNKSDSVKNATVKPSSEDPIPGIDEDAMSITLLRDIDALYFEEGVEYSYEVNIRLYLPDLDFKAELVNAPAGMVLELKSEFNSEVVTSPVDPNAPPVDPNATADPNAPKVKDPKDKPASVANQKIYVIKWKAGFDVIPDDSIQSITRFVTIKVNVGTDKQRSKDFKYVVSQATKRLKITGFDVDKDLREGEKRGKAHVYVNYPGLQTTKFPSVYFEPANKASNVCQSLPPMLSLDSTKYINDPKDPNFESIEYTYTVDLTRFNITANSQTCPMNVYVINAGNPSDPYPVSLTIMNTIADPQTNWAEDLELEFEQEKDIAFYFQVYGQPGEGNMQVRFVKPCSQIFNGQGDCKCRSNTFGDKHRVECLVEANHKKTFNSQTYTIEYEGMMSNGSFTSRKVVFKRRIKFSPKGWSFFDVNGVDTTVDPNSTTNKGDNTLNTIPSGAH